VLSPTDEQQNLDREQLDAALRATVQRRKDSPTGRKDSPDGQEDEPKLPGGPQLRRQRRDDQPLLILYLLDNTKYQAVIEQPMVGFAISFPFSDHEVTAEYAVNEVWQKLQLDDLDQDVEDDDDE
jgi:hypothetical protein